MSREQLLKAVKELGSMPGIYLNTIDQLVNGTVKINKQGIVTVPISIDVKQLGSQVDDIRAVLKPNSLENKLVPFVLFIDPELFLSEKVKP